MLTQDHAAGIFQRLRKHSTGDEIEVIFYGGKSALTRFANNVIHQNVAEENYGVSVRTVFSGKTARATTNRLDEESLLRVVKASETLARLQQSDPDLLPVPSAEEAGIFPAPSPIRYFEETAAITPRQRADAVAQIVSRAKKHNLTTAGIYSSSESVEGIFNSRGLSRWHQHTSAEISITMLGADSSGWQKLNSPDASKLDAARLAEIAAEKAEKSSAPKEMPAGKYSVVLEPSAVLDIAGFMFWDFGGMAVLDQRSFLNDRVGTKVFGENINIWDDVNHPLQSGSPFDGQGVRRQRLQLVKNGVVERLVYARATAEKMRKSEHVANVGPIEATGHGFPLPNEMGEAPMNIVFDSCGPHHSIDEMVVSIERGIYVTRLWYIREVDPYEKILTGMTRDGTFLIEDGKIRHGLRNFRFNESLLKMLSKVEMMSEPQRASGEESFDMVVPAMKVKEFNFTEVTKF